MAPTIGRVLHYRLTNGDVLQIQQRNNNNYGECANPHSEGQTVPLHVVVVWPAEAGEGLDGVNGQAVIDGNFSLWKCSVLEGTEPGTWSWPPRA